MKIKPFLRLFLQLDEDECFGIRKGSCGFGIVTSEKDLDADRSMRLKQEAIRQRRISLKIKGLQNGK